MATYSGSVRRGLPRTPGGQPWPAADAPAPSAASAPQVDTTIPTNEPEVVPAPAVAARAATGPDAATAVSVASVRRGLPRTPGGDPWPPVEVTASASATAAVEQVDTTIPAGEPEVVPAPAVAVRRGLPRTPGGEPWPPAASVQRVETATPATAPTESRPSVRRGLPRPGAQPADAAPAAASVATAPAAHAPAPAPALAPLPFQPSVFGGAAAARWQADRARTIPTHSPIPAPDPTRYGPFTRGQWVGAVIVAAAGLLFAAGMVVLATRWFLSLGFMQDFLATYPGAYELPAGAPVGFPAWLNWQHFLNIFFMVLIIRSGLTVRHQKRPSVFWSPRRNPKRKISIALWFHQSLDILWLVNGVIFVVLLFSTGQWMRLVPTSWDVFPNALSAGLQYLSLDWPVEDGWITYNSLQQLAYFAVVFLAAPLAAITGVRMSGIWPKNATTLNKIYPVEIARAIHFPVMLFFVLFIVGHVTLVFTTGALHNLNSMFAANGGDSWIGFWFFVGAMFVVAIGWVAARPLVLAPIARLFGTVSGR
ncbi:cytochrome b/b6 domain-containing protein [Microbacterium luticocti]|uniref:cytochrome b/b6 domain-containing protein n=1 Tax=Microbacterium luticocti TaxID=451764 RepID=UPI00041FDDFB|nr:cytochrome b/b6 domain-containing protein [Microbacterium luticocti]